MRIETQDYLSLHEKYKEPALTHRRFKHKDIVPLIESIKKTNLFKVSEIGRSVQNRSIFELQYGHGAKKVMLWSQMHGDEPTATMAILDVINFLCGPNSDNYQQVRDDIRENLTLVFIPLLNPDGAELFQRRNAQQIDLNRDARAMEAPEARLLGERAKVHQPMYGFNLHDQNIYYNVPNTTNPVGISFLAPAYNWLRETNEVRGRAMQIIAGMFEMLDELVPNTVAKYDDTHSPRGFGDNFQSWGTSTILIESGARKGDPEKQEIRKLNFMCLLRAFKLISSDSYSKYSISDYENIPFNASQLHDVVIRNVEVMQNGVAAKIDIAIRREEHTVKGDYYTKGYIEDLGDLKDEYGYDELSEEGLRFVPGEVAKGFLKEVNKELVAEYLKKGVVAIELNKEANSAILDNHLHSYPIELHHEGSYKPAESLSLGKRATFLLVDKSGVKYAVINGYLIDVNVPYQQEFKMNFL